MSSSLVIILGPTASGKTNLATKIAYHLEGEIISADSRQIFKGMDIGTGKDLGEYVVGGNDIPYHLIDIKDAGEFYNVNNFKQDFYSALKSVREKKKLPILCGGTGMYIHSILQNQPFTAVPKNEKLRSELAGLEKNKLQQKLNTYPEKLTLHADLNSAKRLIRAIEIAEFLSYNDLPLTEYPPISPIVIGLQSDITYRRQRILNRLNFRLENGLIAEVENLLEIGVPAETLIFYGLEYKFVVAYLKNEISYSELKDKLGTAICQYAKRQMTFFRKMEKDGIDINWLSTEEGESALLKKTIEIIQQKKSLTTIS